MSRRIEEQVWAIKDEEVKDARLLVLLTLADHANNEGQVWVTIPTIAEFARVTDRHVRRVMRWLEDKGYLTDVVNGNGRGNVTSCRVVIIKADIGDIKADIGDMILKEEREKEEEKKVTQRKEEEREKEERTMFLSLEQRKTVSDNTNSAGARVSGEQVVAFYRVNIDPKIKPATEEALHHLCLKHGNELVLEALKESLLNNKHMGKPTFNFIQAVCLRMEQDRKRGQVLRSAIQGSFEDVEFDKPENDGLAKFREQIYGQGDDNE